MKKITVAFLMVFLMFTLVGCKVPTLEELGFSSTFQEDLGKELEKYGFTSSYQQEVDELLKSGEWQDVEVDDITQEIEKQAKSTKKTKKTKIVRNKIVIDGMVTPERAQEIKERYGIEVDPSRIKSNDTTQEVVDVPDTEQENSSSETADENN